MMIEEIVSPSYLVGGSVRDKLLGREPKDWDFCTPIEPDGIERLVREAGKRAFLTGKRFGTIGFKHEGMFVEVTTFRAEEYTGSRKPQVEFVESLIDDLSRRDFTINAMAERNGRIYDPFSGRSDLSAGLIRAVGIPSHRFKEDPLRMLRACRFVAQLGFNIEEKTLSSIKKNAHKILEVSKERWTQELDRLITEEHAADGVLALLETDLMKFLLPELRLQFNYDQNSDYHELPLHLHSINTMSQVPTDKNLRWAALLHDIGKPFVRTDNKRGTSNYVFHDIVGAELIYGIGKRLKWSNERTQEVQELVRTHLEDSSPLRAADNSSKAHPQLNI